MCVHSQKPDFIEEQERKQGSRKGAAGPKGAVGPIDCNAGLWQNGVTPTGGMGQSSRCSQIFWTAPDCVNGIKLDGTQPAQFVFPGSWFSEQVIRIEVNSKVSSRKYGHDKSYCWQDATIGLASCDGVITTRMQCCNPPVTVQSGSIVWLQVYPMGLNNGAVNPVPVIRGYALIEEDPFVMNLENGDPVEHNMKFASKGCWTLPLGVNETFDCCQCCPACAANMQAIDEFADDAGLLDSDPVTVYKWTTGGEWSIAFDELPAGYTRGPAPDPRTDKAKKEGELRFIKCVKVAPTADLHSHSGIMTVGA